MSRKKKKAKRQMSLQPLVAPIFAVGARVRVKKGTRDPDYPDMPLGGWAGTIRECDDRGAPPVYLVAWDAYTLQHAHPVCRNRCERDGLDWTSSWMGEEDLEADTGGPRQMEQPTELHARPLDPNVQEDRILAVFQRTGDDPWPPINDANLCRYYEFLAANLTLPIAVQYVDLEAVLSLDSRPTASSEPLKIVELLAPKEGEAADGLFCVTVRGEQRQALPLSHLEPVRQDRNWRLMADYALWFWESETDNAPVEPADDTADYDTPSWRWALNTLSQFGLWGAAVGAAVAAIAATMDYVLYAMAVAAVTLALVGYVAGTRLGFFFGNVQRIKGGPILGGIAGLLAGLIAGVVAGPLVIAYLGTILGSIAGAVAGQGLRMINRRLPGPLVGGGGGALLGAIVLAWTINPDETLTSLLYGIPAGAVAGVVLIIALLALAALIHANQEKTE